MYCHMSYNVVCTVIWTVKPQYLKLKLVQDILGCEIKMLKKVLKHRLNHFHISKELIMSIFKTLSIFIYIVLFNVVCTKIHVMLYVINVWCMGKLVLWPLLYLTVLVHWPLLFLYCRLPEGLTQLGNLTQLYLNDTFLDYLPGTFGRWEPVYCCSSIIIGKILNKHMLNWINKFWPVCYIF